MSRSFSILRDSRYRTDQRQLYEEEEKWFNEDDDFDENETVVSPATDLLPTKKIDPNLENIGKIMDNSKKTNVTNSETTNGPKVNSISPSKQGVLNNNASGGSPPSPTIQDGKPSVLFKKVCKRYLCYIRFVFNEIISGSCRL